MCIVHGIVGFALGFNLILILDEVEKNQKSSIRREIEQEIKEKQELTQ